MSDFLAANSILVLILAFVLLALSAILTPFVVAVIQWRLVRHAEIDASAHRAELEAALKREMLNRGMSAADIRQVLDSHTDAVRTAGDGGNADGKERFGKKWAALGRMWAAWGKARHRRCDSSL
jgi:hypothetical protein